MDLRKHHYEQASGIDGIPVELFQIPKDHAVKMLHSICQQIWKTQQWPHVRKHLTGGFLCAVVDLSGILWPLLIPEYSGIKRRGMPFPGLRNPGISHYGD